MARSLLDNLKNIFRSSLTPVIPENLIKKSLKFDANAEELNILGNNYKLKNKNLYVVGTGKAVKDMAHEVENILQSRLKYGIISIPEGSLKSGTQTTNLLYLEGAKNNLPDDKAKENALKIKSLVSGLTKNDILLVLISGGGSALLPLPKGPINLAEKTSLIKKLANAGADIQELNTVRKRISDIKGGQLALLAQPAQVISLILSDIVGDPLDLIASGPTVENKDTKSAALAIINKYNLFNDLPSSIRQILQETDNVEKEFPHENVQNIVIGSNKLSIQFAKKESNQIGYTSLALSNTITGNILDVACKYITLTKIFCDYMNKKIDTRSLLSEIKSIDLPIRLDEINQLNSTEAHEICLILGGETTVQVKGSGKGGRNQQLALEFSKLLHENKEIFNGWDIHFLSAGTDGIDGPTDAAGAIGYLNLVTDSVNSGLDVDAYLKNNDAYNFYSEFKNGDLHIITGHTNTNVMDIHLILITKK